jgi:hypothetical protein
MNSVPGCSKTGKVSDGSSMVIRKGSNSFDGPWS